MHRDHKNPLDQGPRFQLGVCPNSAREVLETPTRTHLDSNLAPVSKPVNSEQKRSSAKLLTDGHALGLGLGRCWTTSFHGSYVY